MAGKKGADIIARTAEMAERVDANAIQKKNVSKTFNDLIDSNKMRGRFDELLGKRAPQFISSMVTMVNSSDALKQVYNSAPMTIVTSCLKAASYGLPIDPGLGFAYVVPFRKRVNENGRWTSIQEAQMVVGYKGLIQLAERSGAYKRINAVELKEGELKRWDRLTEDYDIEWIEDEAYRESLPSTGYIAYFELVNGMKKVVYMSRKQIEEHEYANRKGAKLDGNGERIAAGGVWKDNFDAMALKTVLRRLLSKWGLLSIDYQSSPNITAAEALSESMESDDTIDADGDLIEATFAEEGVEQGGNDQ